MQHLYFMWISHFITNIFKTPTLKFQDLTKSLNSTAPLKISLGKTSSFFVFLPPHPVRDQEEYNVF